MAATEPIRDKKQLKALADYFLRRGELRNYALVVIGASTALRISDLLSLAWDDVCEPGHAGRAEAGSRAEAGNNAEAGNSAEAGSRAEAGGELGQPVFRAHVTLIERKTGKEKAIALNGEAVHALRLCHEARRGRHIFASNRQGGEPISRVQAWRIIRMGVEAVGIAGKVASHSLRKTWGYHAWQSGRVSPVVIMDIYNHNSYETTRRYLGVAQDDLDRAYQCQSLFGLGK